MGLLALLMSTIFVDFYAGILAVEVVGYGTPESVVGLIFAVSCLTYTLMSVLIEKTLEIFKRRLIIAIGLLFLTIGLFLLGPSKLLALPRSIGLIITGLAVIGIGNALVMVPIFPEIYDGICIAKGLTDDDELSDKVSGFVTLFYSIGSGASLIIGGFLGQVIGYRKTCDTLGVTALSFLILFFLFNITWKDFTLLRIKRKPNKVGSNAPLLMGSEAGPDG